MATERTLYASGIRSGMERDKIAASQLAQTVMSEIPLAHDVSAASGVVERTIDRSLTIRNQNRNRPGNSFRLLDAI